MFIIYSSSIKPGSIIFGHGVSFKLAITLNRKAISVLLLKSQQFRFLQILKLVQIMVYFIILISGSMTIFP
jgi:hypothetical protein